MPRYTQEEIEFIKNNYRILGCYKCSEILKRNPKSLGNLAKKLGLTLTTEERKTFFSEEEIEFIKKNYHEKGSKVCADFCSQKRHQIINKANELGIYAKDFYTKDQTQFIMENYPIHGVKICADYCNKNKKTVAGYAITNLGLGVIKKNIINVDQFLDIKTPEVAYYLGYLWADGHVTPRFNEVSLSIVKVDMENVEWIFDKIGSFGKRIIDTKGNRRQKKILRTSCYDLAKILKENDYVTKSGASACKILDKIPDNLKHYWWRGYLDGDGCIAVDKRGAYSVMFASCYKQDWTFAEKLFSELGIKFHIDEFIGFRKCHNRTIKYSNIYCYKRDDCLALLSYIYKDREADKIGLDRKYNKYLTMVSQILKNKNYRKNNREKNVYLCDSNNNILKEYNSIAGVARDFKIKYSKCQYSIKKCGKFKINDDLHLKSKTNG